MSGFLWFADACVVAALSTVVVVAVAVQVAVVNVDSRQKQQQSKAKTTTGKAYDRDIIQGYTIWWVIIPATPVLTAVSSMANNCEIFLNFRLFAFYIIIICIIMAIRHLAAVFVDPSSHFCVAAAYCLLVYCKLLGYKLK